jgi:uncharacterized protein involved in copper resistance
VTVVALSPFAAQQALATGAGEVPREAPSPSALPTNTDPMAGMNHDMPGMDGAQMPGMDHDMPGMDHNMPGMSHDLPGMNGTEMPGMTTEDMPGMDHGSATSAQSGTASGSAGPGAGHSHSDAEPAAEPRPTAALVGVFVAVNAGVMGSALVLRRHDHSASGNSRPRASRRQSQDSEVR